MRLSRARPRRARPGRARLEVGRDQEKGRETRRRARLDSQYRRTKVNVSQLRVHQSQDVPIDTVRRSQLPLVDDAVQFTRCRYSKTRIDPRVNSFTLFFYSLDGWCILMMLLDGRDSMPSVDWPPGKTPKQQPAGDR